MPVAILIPVAIPVLLLGIYAWGRANYGEKWYLAFGRNSTWGADDPVAQELDEARFTALHLKDSEDKQVK